MNFVAVNDRVHGLLRECTRRTPLGATGPGRAIRYQIRVGGLSNSYFSLAAFHALQGLPAGTAGLPRWRMGEAAKAEVTAAAGYFDATRLDRRCRGDLRLRPAGSGSVMVAADLLAFGTGALRAAGLAAAGASDLAAHGRLVTPAEAVYARIGALRCGPGSSNGNVEREVYCSTNVVYGDALGEVEQLWDRRADTEFLDQVARHLHAMRHWAGTPAPAQAPLNFESVMKLHLRAQQIWRLPPANGRVLLRRIEYLLEHLIVDNCPETHFHPPGRNPGLDRDRSGYDGWLLDPGAGPV